MNDVFKRYYGEPEETKRNIQSEEQRRNNPRNEPVGHFTGRCKRCHSNDLWDDNLAYGCNRCGAIYT